MPDRSWRALKYTFNRAEAHTTFRLARFQEFFQLATSQKAFFSIERQALKFRVRPGQVTAAEVITHAGHKTTFDPKPQNIPRILEKASIDSEPRSAP
jgi:hypothetical protein